MQDFKTSGELMISEDEYDALVELLGMLDRGELVHIRKQFSCDAWESVPLSSEKGFNMECSGYQRDCGTVACIGGWVAYLMGLRGSAINEYVTAVDRSVYPITNLYWDNTEESTTPRQAALAVRNFLTFGHPKWEEVVRRS